MAELPIRVLAIVFEHSPHWSKAWDHPEEIASLGLAAIKETNVNLTIPDDALVRTLAKERYGTMAFVVFDVGHVTYDPAQAHLLEFNNLPVYAVHFKPKRIAVQLATLGVRNRVNKDIAVTHNRNGWGSEPIFEEDHSDGKVPVYMNPRDPKLFYR